MGLGPTRVVFQGETPYAHEREAIEHVLRALPNNDPYHAWALVDLLDTSSGRLYELDLVVLGYSALYVIEIKSGPGRYEGDQSDWYRFPAGEARGRYLDNPLRLTNHKAKILASLLRAQMKRSDLCPRVEALVFLSAEDIDVRLRPEGALAVVTREKVLRALTHHEFLGANPALQGRRIDGPVARDVVNALKAIGVRPRKGKAHVGAYELDVVLGAGPGYEDRLARHREKPLMTRRARVYLVPQQTSVERRLLLRRAADREAQLLWDVAEHSNILRIADYVPEAPLGPTVLFDVFEGGVPLDVFVRSEVLTFDERVEIIQQLSRALTHCHRRGVVHGAVAPEAVLLRWAPDSRGRTSGARAVELRLFNFQLGRSDDVESTSHGSMLASDALGVYVAPELREVNGTRSVLSDVFSFGALAYFLFTGRAPADNALELDRRLASEKCLDPRAVDDSLPEPIVEFITQATTLTPSLRPDDASEWFDLMYGELTRPASETATEVDPLEANKTDVLGSGGDLLVIDVLGQGATARVLRVRRQSDDREYALKVPLVPDFESRFADEAAVLTRLSHDRIAKLIAQPILAGRHCLLLSLAGERTLQRYLQRQGPVSLDLAARWGEDLLAALEHLEEHGVLHRDVKPANLGVGSMSKTASHLALFDFSLVRAAATELHLGTSAYRDPFLRQRGAWDFAADRWSAAITLHEMITGVRPGLGEVPSLEDTSTLVLAAERFDAAARDRLVAFFEKALARDAVDRFLSARDMRLAWLAAVDGAARAAVTATSAAAPRPLDAQGAPLPDRIAQITDDTPIAALPLSARAINALDRAGIARAEDLLGLADNRLSAIRGIGVQVAKEILALRDAWRARRSDTATAAVITSFYAGYRGEDALLATTDIDRTIIASLANAGLWSTRALAAAPATHVATIGERNKFDAKVLRTLLDELHRAADQTAHPTTLERWVDALLPPKKKAWKRTRRLFGLEAPFEGRIDIAVRELAEHEEITTAAVYIDLGKRREEWRQHPALGSLREWLSSLLDSTAGCAPLGQLAETFVADLPHDTTVDVSSLRARGAALARVVAEADKDGEDGVQLVRLREGDLWIVRTPGHARALRALGDAADTLAARAVLASSDEAKRELARALFETLPTADRGAASQSDLAGVLALSPLAGLRDDRAMELAALASSHAACSARLELYPRALPAERAVELCQPILGGKLTPADVQSRVASRYSMAAPLPERPALDALMSKAGFVWDDAGSRYTRPGDLSSSTVHTRVSSIGASFVPAQARTHVAPELVAAQEFEAQVKLALEYHSFRVLAATADRAHDAALAVARVFGLRLVALDTALVSAIETQRIALGIAKDDVIYDADGIGRTGPSWMRLMTLVDRATEALAKSLFPVAEPTLFVQPGLLARYQRSAFLRTLIEQGKDPSTPASFLLVPSHDTTSLPTINGELAIPGLFAAQVLWVARDWLALQTRRVA